jgi:MFS family permease
MEAQSESQRLTVGRLVIVLLSRTTLNTAYRIVYPFLPSIARGLGISLQAATALTSLRLFAGMAAPILGPLAEQYGRRRSMELGLVFLSCAGLLLAATGTFAFAAVAFVLLAWQRRSSTLPSMPTSATPCRITDEGGSLGSWNCPGLSPG